LGWVNAFWPGDGAVCLGGDCKDLLNWHVLVSFEGQLYRSFLLKDRRCVTDLATHGRAAQRIKRAGQIFLLR
jgi:hypothetical protein